MPILLAFLALPLVEIALFIVVGGWIGVWPTLGLVALAGVAGLLVLRMTGMAAIAALRGTPGDRVMAAALPVADSALRMAAGMLLILPGFLTDVLALALLLPPVRRALIAAMARRVVVTRPGPARDAVIDGDYVDLDARPGSRPQDLTRH